MFKSFVFATRNSWHGIVFAFRSERHVREETAALAVSFPAAFLITGDGWLRIALIATIINLLTIEFLNTALEKLCDHVHLDHHVVIKAVKDMGSAAVLGGLLIALSVWGFALWVRVVG